MRRVQYYFISRILSKYKKNINDLLICHARDLIDLNKRLETMENLRQAIDRGKFHDDEMNWKNFGYVEIFEDIHFSKIRDFCDW